MLSVDEALLARLLENLMNNSVRHNPKPVNITVHTRRAGERFCLTVADDGIGYPAAVLVALNAAEPAENAPHILGLYVVQQIAAAHGGMAVFGQNTPCGAKTTVWLPAGREQGKKENSEKTGRCLQLLQTAVLLLCFFIFIQRIKLLQDLGVFQLDDLAGEVVQGVFLRHIQKADAYRAQRLRLGAGTLVHLAVAVFDIAQHRLAR